DGCSAAEGHVAEIDELRRHAGGDINEQHDILAGDLAWSDDDRSATSGIASRTTLAIRGRSAISLLYRLTECVDKLRSIDGGVPRRDPGDAVTARRVNGRITIAAPPARRARRKVLIPRVLEEKEACVELAKRVLVYLAGNPRQRDVHGHVARRREVRAVVHHLFGRLWHVLEWQLSRPMLLEASDEGGAVDVGEKQFLLDGHRRRTED